MIPSYLKNTTKEISINDFLNAEIVTTSNEETFEILYCGMLKEIKGNQLITWEAYEIPLKIIAKSTLSGKEILLYDGAYYGYDCMFCDEFEADATQNRGLKKYFPELLAGKTKWIGTFKNNHFYNEPRGISKDEMIAYQSGIQVVRRL